MPREILEGGITVDGHYIPQSTEIGTPIYAIQHTSVYFPMPFSFQPERWLNHLELESLAVSQATTKRSRTRKVLSVPLARDPENV